MSDTMFTKLNEAIGAGRFTFRGLIGLIVVLGCFTFLFMLFFYPIPPENKDVMHLSAGILLALSGMVVGWYFGSSKGKDDAEKVQQARAISTTQETTTTSKTPAANG